MNELQVAYQAFSFFLEETILGNMCTPGIPFRFQGSVIDTQGGGAEPESGEQRPGLESQGWPHLAVESGGWAAWLRAAEQDLRGQERGACLGLQRLGSEVHVQ